MSSSASPAIANGASSSSSSSLSPSSALQQPNGSSSSAPSGTRSRMASRRASNQSRELSTMDLPDPSRLNETTTTSTATRPDANLLRASDALGRGSSSSNGAGGDDDASDNSSPFVKSIPSSPYLGATRGTNDGSLTPNGTHVAAKFGDTLANDELVEKLEKLDLPEPEYLQEEHERERAARELGDVMSNLNLPEPEYVVRANMRAQGARTPEPVPRQEGSVELVRSLSQKLRGASRQ